MPKRIKEAAELIEVSKLLNRAIGTNYYNPNTLQDMTQAQIDDLLIASLLVS